MKNIGKCLVIIVVLVLVGALLLFCGRIMLEKQDVESTVTDFMEAYISADAVTCNELLYSTYTESGETFSELQILLAQNITYDIQESQKQTDYYIVSLDIENVDFGNVMEEIEKNYSDADESIIYAAMMDGIRTCERKRNFECKVTILKVGEDMKIMMTDSLSNALFGGLNEYISVGLYGEE